jgi:RNA polymerase sigma-70 factor (ECF subfamily)
MDDQKIIELFFARSELAIQSLAAKYEKLLHKISFQILHNDEDVAECINDTYLGVWNAIPPERPNPLSAFVCKITRNLSLNKYRANTAEKRNASMDVSLEELEPVIPTPSAEEEWNAKELGKQINLFLHTLEKENRVLFVRRYWFADSVKDIARDMKMSENLASVRLKRIRKQLKSFLEQEGYTI